MKKNIYARLAALAALAVMAAGCSDTGDGLDPAGGDPVQFSAGIATRTAAGGNEWRTSDEIGIFAVKESGTLPNDLVTGVGVNVKYHPDADGASANLLPAASPIYWPQNGVNNDFIACYPWKAVGAGGIDPTAYTYPVDVTDQSDPAALDILYAKTTGKQKGEPVPFMFGHAMAKVRVNITPADDIGDRDLAGMTAAIEGMPTTAGLVLDDGTFSGSGAPAVISMPGTDAGTYAASFEAVVIPHGANEFDGRSFSFGFTDMEPRRWVIPDADDIPAGKVRTYNLKVGRDGVVLVITGIDDWGGTDGTPDDEDATLAGIHNADDLIAFSRAWNATGDISDNAERAAAQETLLSRWSRNGRADGAVTLWADIDMSSVVNFTPIGSNSNRFTGTFDGNGYTISNLTVNVTGDYAGLFGVNSGTVRNIILEDCDITATGNNSGGIAGLNSGTISGCQITGGEVKATQFYSGGIVGRNSGSLAKIENCTASGTAKIEAQYYSGGIAGRNDSGTISGCQMTGGEVKATRENAGGIAGYNSGSDAKIENCTVSGTAKIEAERYSGGIAGRNSDGTISGCDMTGGEVTATQNNAGGIAGLNDQGTISGCDMTGGEVTAAQYNAGGIAGLNSGTISGCDMTGGEVKATQFYSGGIVGNNFGSDAKIENCTVSGTAKIEAQDYAGGIAGWNEKGTISGCQMTGGEVKATRENAGGIAGRNESSTISDCDMKGGIVKATQYSAGGIAGYNSGSDAKIENCTVWGTAKIEAQSYAGGIAGKNDRGTISGCQMTGGEVMAIFYAGGIAGGNVGTISGCDMTGGEVKATQDYAGGIAGMNDSGTISSCQMTGGEVMAALSYAGGIAGNNSGSDAKIENCTVSGTANIEAQYYSGGIAGHNFGSDAKIENCTVSGTAKIEAHDYSGGIAGENISGGTISGCDMTGGEVKATQDNSGGITGVNKGHLSKIENCTVLGTAKIEAENSAGGIAGRNESGTISGCQMTGGEVMATQNYAGGIAGMNTGGGTITACISAPGNIICTGSSTGVVVGQNTGTINSCYWAEGVVAGNPAVGTGSVSGGDSFDKDDVPPPGSFFTTGSPSPIGQMNQALASAGSQWRWKAGDAMTGWWPVCYIP